MLIVLLALIIMIVGAVPIAYAIGLAASIGIFLTNNIPTVVVPQRMFTMLDSFSLLAIPFFILAGNLMDRGGISKKLVNFASSMVGHIRGGLGMVAVISCMLFGAISGSGAAATAAIGSILIPAMKKEKYDPEFSGAISSVSGPLGIIIPPSVVMVIYATTANVSVGDMFLAGYIPGILIAAGLIFTVYIIALKNNYPAGPKPSLKNFLVSLKESVWALLMILIIMGGILSGLFTATEAACVSVVYSLIVGMFIYKELKIKDLPKIFHDSALTTAGVMFCVATTNILAWFMTHQQIPMMVSKLLTDNISSKIVLLLMINIIFLFLGTILDSTPAIILSVPILLPIAQSIGVDPVHFGLIATVNLAIGQSTPPVGLTLFVGSSIAGVKLQEMMKYLIPFWISSIIALMLVTYIPQISMFLPNLIGG